MQDTSKVNNLGSKSVIQNQLESLETIKNVFPTPQQRMTRGNTKLIVDAVSRFDTTTAESASFDGIRNLREAGAVASDAIGQLMSSSNNVESLVAFVSAGFNFFEATSNFINNTLRNRQRMGGNGAVTRVMRSNSGIVLETINIIVGFASDLKDVDRKKIESKFGLIRIKAIGLTRKSTKYAIDKGFASDICLKLMNLTEVEFAEPDFIEHVGQRSATGEPYYQRQWHHHNISSPLAWSISTGRKAKIAVIDNGFDVSHPDLRLNPSLSGWFRGVPGQSDADFIAGLTGMPDEDHGTACAGMIGSPADAKQGVGVAYDCDLRAIACLGDQVGLQSTLAEAIVYAADPSLPDNNTSSSDGADVISCSLGPNGAYWTMRRVLSEAINDAAEDGRDGKGIPIFWACTNGNYPIEHDEVCSHEKTIVVGRSTSTDNDDGSGYGPELDFLAPGTSVLIPASGGDYQITTGTSFAAPCAAGIAGLMLAQDSSLTARQVLGQLRASCDKIGNMPYDNERNDRFGFGRVNAYKALK